MIHALDYAAISEAVTSLVEKTDYQLIETLAERVTELILRDFSATNVRLKLSKPGAVPNAKNVAVEICRGTN